jgi:hypothetical protein
MAETPENHASEASHAPGRQPLTGPFDFMVRGFRPAAGWACAIVILVRGAVVPLWELARGSDASPIDWAMLVALVGMLGLARYRHLEKTSGATV